MKYFLKNLGFGPRGHSKDPLPGWTSVDLRLTPPPPLLVHVVVECPQTLKAKNPCIIEKY